MKEDRNISNIFLFDAAAVNKRESAAGLLQVMLIMKKPDESPSGSCTSL